MSFLEKNLNALATKPIHQGLIAKLEKMTPPDATKFAVYETHDGDLTLESNKCLLHSLNGAQKEAQQVVAQDANKNVHGQNLLVGLGLGYVLKAVLKEADEKRHKGAIFVLETDLDLLNFVLSHVDLSQELQHPLCKLYDDETLLFQGFIERYIQGDGVGMIFTEGSSKRYGEQVIPLFKRIQKRMANVKLNTFLLQDRSKEWAETFLANTPYLNQTRPVDCFTGLFAGQTLVLAGSGPSLEEAIPTLKAIRKQVVIMAVPGAVRALLKAGITPDFVTFMDCLGPSKYLHGLEGQLADCHFIVGPSVEPFVFEQASQQVWLAAQHFNEQFTYMLDDVFERLMFRYHTGGTVSMFSLQIAVEMGFKRYWLVGQDLALRGTQVYAGGSNAEVDLEKQVLQIAASETTVARSIPLLQVEGQNGQKIWTQEDYAHFIEHFEGVPRLILETIPEAQLINASVGGALLKGWEHRALSDVSAGFEMLSPLDKAGIYQQALERTKEWHDDTLAERFYTGVLRLQEETQKFSGWAKEGLKLLEKLMDKQPHQWAAPSQKYSEKFNQLAEALEGHSFFHDTFYHEQLALRHHYNENADSAEQIRENFKLDKRYLEHMVKQFDEVVLTWVEVALQKQEEARPSLKQASLV
jgi:hypothetical protein